MSKPVNYTNSGEDSLAGRLTQHHYSEQTPEAAVSNRILPASPIAGQELEFIEVEFDGVPHLCIKTPAIVNGPGKKFKATAVVG